jgi:hypothetical protein
MFTIILCEYLTIDINILYWLTARQALNPDWLTSLWNVHHLTTTKENRNFHISSLNVIRQTYLT